MTSRSFNLFSLTGLDIAAGAYSGMCYDGRWVYVAKYGLGAAYNGKSFRFDSSKEVDDTTAYQFYDPSALSTDARGFVGCIFITGMYISSRI